MCWRLDATGKRQGDRDGHDSRDFIWIRVVRYDCAELYGAAAHPQEARIEQLSGTAVKMI